MKSFEQVVKEYYDSSTSKSASSILEEMVKEALYYRDANDEAQGPIGSTQKVASDIAKYIARVYPQHYAGHDLLLKGGKRVLQFTNFGSLSTRDIVIRDLVEKGWLDAPKVKRLGLYHRATTRFFDVAKSGKEIPIEIQLNSGAGAGRAGIHYETEMARFLNKKFRQMNRQYEAVDEGGTTNNPDITIWSPNFESQDQFMSFEIKHAAAGVSSLDFGQFQVQRDGEVFVQKTQLDSEEMRAIFGVIEQRINNICTSLYNPEESGDLVNIDVKDLGSRVERYYAEKYNDFIIYNDRVYSITDKGEFLLPTALRFRDSVGDSGFIRLRVKCHGSSYSTTAAAKFKSIKGSVSILDDQVLDVLFPATENT